MTLCPFALLTGIACPGCGMTRAFLRFFAGDVAGALAFHPLFVLVLAIAVGTMTWLVGRRLWKWPRISTRLLHGGLVSVGVAFLSVWIMRMATGSLPPV